MTGRILNINSAGNKTKPTRLDSPPSGSHPEAPFFPLFLRLSSIHTNRKGQECMQANIILLNFIVINVNLSREGFLRLS